MEAKKTGKLLIRDYLAIEQENQQRYEYHDGAFFMMAGGSIQHGFLCGNVYGELRTSLKATEHCKAIPSDVKLYIKSENTFVYPDCMVICGEILVSEEEKNAITNPTLIIEVLSKTTSSYDRGDKFHLYRQIPSLREYVLIEQDKILVEVYEKKEDLWKISRYTDLKSRIVFHSIKTELPMQEIYRDVNFNK
ncbi:MAG TPA: Uma2 family endonuclease [Saprospiraceae bacterium]|nr:Uma2 family endonuclease [Saprospiraceae bacterium]HMQ81733.1 Uma2 family endonuclease [Saprospiraceae bacterium]